MWRKLSFSVLSVKIGSWTISCCDKFDRFALLYQLSKEVIKKPKKEPSLPDACDTTIPAKKQSFGEKIYEGIRVTFFNLIWSYRYTIKPDI